jgi:hypothetical protein
MLNPVTSIIRSLQALPLNASAIAEITRVSQPYLHQGQTQPVEPVEAPQPGPMEISRVLRNAESMVASALGVNAAEVCINANIRYYRM